jgi:hypothetical protein
MMFRWMLLAIFALAPTAVLAQQDTEKAQTQTEAAQKQTEQAEPKGVGEPAGSKEAAHAEYRSDPDGGPDTKKTQEDGKLISVPGGKALGMSILGNQEAPKALVIVPWKQSELSNVLGISTILDDSRQPIDKEVFMRMLSYYDIRSETARPGSAPTEKNAAQPNTAAQRRKP